MYVSEDTDKQEQETKEGAMPFLHLSVDWVFLNTLLCQAAHMKACSQVIARMDPKVPPPSAKSTGKGRVWKTLPEGIYLHSSKLKQTANKTRLTFHVLTCTKKKILFLFHSTSLHLFFFESMSFSKLLLGRSSHKAFFLPHLEAFPPSSLPGIPESILAIENVKNEEKQRRVQVLRQVESCPAALTSHSLQG